MSAKGFVYSFSARVWYSEWYFVSLPKALARDIRENFKGREEGWGRLRANVKIGGSEWGTSLFYDTKHETYLLPVKKEVRSREKIGVDTEVQVELWI